MEEPTVNSNKSKKLFLLIFLIISSCYFISGSGCSCDSSGDSSIIIYNPVPGNSGRIITNYSIAVQDTLLGIPESAIIAAKYTLHIAYGHTSHGSQIITGISSLDAFMTNNGSTSGLYAWNNGPLSGALDIRDGFAGGDLGNPDRTSWASATREYLRNPDNSDVNVVMWSWCGQVSSSTEEDIITYLNLMNKLEIDYPDITFVYMTGHLDGSGEEGNLNQRNNQIREYCESNEKALYDFADIESYDPDNIYYLDRYATDGCYYDSDSDGSQDANWAEDWQNSHTEGTDWYECGDCAHSVDLNCNKKAYAAWWLWARIAGWDGALKY